MNGSSAPGIAAFVNGEQCEFAPGATVDDVLERIGTSRRGCAVARNGEVVPKGQWSSTLLESGDRLEVLSAAPGG